MRALLLFLLAPATALALPLSFDVEHFGRVRLDPPKNWIVMEKRLRAPLMLAAPMPSGQRFRTTLSLYPVEGVSEAQLSGTLDGGAKGYKAAKEAWVKEKGGSVEKFSEPSEENWGQIKHVKRFGVTYNLDGNRFEESSYYFSCRGKPLFAKVLHPVVKGSEADGDAAEKSLRSLACQ